MSHGCKNTTWQNEKIVYFSTVKTEKKKKKKSAPSDEPTVHIKKCQRASVGVFGTLREV
jgi:hypothetical protein